VCLVDLVAIECEQHRERLSGINAVIHDQHTACDRVLWSR
jgi:hypothetical protein